MRLLSIIIGLIIGLLIGYFVMQNSKNHHGPNSKDIVGHIFKFKDKYYKFSPVICPCPLLHG